MQPNPNPKLDELLITMAAFYGADMTETQLNMWARILSDVPFPAIEAAAMKLMRDPKIERMPIPAKLRALAMPSENEISDEDVARDTANRIWDAIGRFGWTNSTRACEALGDLGWSVVERMGGWQNLCTMDSEERGTFVAQARDYALTRIRLERAGHGRTKYEIPSPSKPSALPDLAAMAENATRRLQ